MALLRAPGGCPWDAEQTHASLIRYLVEEAYEVVEAVETGGAPNMPLLREELGDVLLQVVFHSDIAAANPQGFDIVQVVEGLVQKLRSRHPMCSRLSLRALRRRPAPQLSSRRRGMR